jgi:hypothetical protein
MDDPAESSPPSHESNGPILIGLGGSIMAGLLLFGITGASLPYNWRQMAIAPLLLLAFLAFISAALRPRYWVLSALLLGAPTTLLLLILAPTPKHPLEWLVTLLVVPASTFGTAFVTQLVVRRRSRS